MPSENSLVSLVNTRGRVMWVRAWEIDNLRRQGCKVIYNPKEEYYPQYDLSVDQVKPDRDTLFEEPRDNTVEPGDFLNVEEI